MQEGSLRDNGLQDGSKIILIPNVETGLLVSSVCRRGLNVEADGMSEEMNADVPGFSSHVVKFTMTGCDYNDYWRLDWAAFMGPKVWKLI